MNRDMDWIRRALGTALAVLVVGGLPSLVAAQAIPKVALIVVGDPDTALQDAASRVRESVTGLARFPSDPALEAALRGVHSTEDGLDRIRAERRSLGLDEAADVPTLARLGQLTSSDVLLLVRNDGLGPALLVFHVRHSGFLVGTLFLPEASAAQIHRFVQQRIGDPRPASDPEAAGSATTVTTAANTGETNAAAIQPVQVAEAASSSPAEEDDATWFERHWPLLAGGALLLGVIVWFAWPDGDETAPPTLSFVPGGQ